MQHIMWMDINYNDIKIDSFFVKFKITNNISIIETLMTHHMDSVMAVAYYHLRNKGYSMNSLMYVNVLECAFRAHYSQIDFEIALYTKTQISKNNMDNNEIDRMPHT